MNTSHLKSILLFFVGLMAMPGVAFALSGSRAPACVQKSEKSGDGDQEPDDPMSLSSFSPDPSSVFLSPSSEFVRPLVRAVRLHKEGDHNDAAELIGQFLADVGDETFLVWSDKSKGTAVSVSRIATEMLGSLPKSAIDSYRVRFGVPARQRLSLAIAESNYFEISQVMQRYPYTEAGIEAAMLMGHHHFDAGRPLLAAEGFYTALELGKGNGNGKPDSQLSVLTAVSWALARRPDLAEIVMKDLASANGGKFRLGDKEVLVDDDDPLAAIKSFVGAGPLDSSTKVDQWLLASGNPRGNVTTADGFPVGQPIWQVDLTANRASQRAIENTRESMASETSLSFSLVPASVPLIVDGLVLVGNEKQVSAVDFKSGKRVWAVATGPDAGANTDEPQRSAAIRVFQAPSRTPTPTYDRAPWTDFLQGHASSDGKFIFHVVRSLAAPVDNLNGRQAFFSRFEGEKTTNTLQAIDVLKEGGLAWEVGAGQTTGDPRLAEVSFLGAPLPIDGVLYAIGKHLQEIVLVALNSEDGKLVWMQALATDGATPRSRYARQSVDKKHSLTPSFYKGILVCPTGQDALVAVDTIGRRVLWGAHTSGSGSSSYSKVNPMLVSQNPQVFVDNSRVVAFDVSKECRLLAVSLLDGSPLMKSGKAGVRVEEALHVASVDENKVVLVERTRVRAISYDSGRTLWRTSIQKFGPPTGRGYVSEKSLYLPTEGNSIVKIDLETGDVVDGVSTDQPLGNLIVHQGRVISRRETSVSCFELDSKVVAELAAAAEAAGGIGQVTTALKIKQAALLRNRGEVKQAIELLQTIAEDERSGRFKMEFLQSGTLLFESDPEFALMLFKQYENWFRYESDPKMFLGYVELLVKYGMKDDAIDQLFKINSFFNQREADADSVLLQRPVAGYNLNPSEEEEGEESGAEESKAEKNKAEKNKAAKKANQDDSSDDDPAGKKVSLFLTNKTAFSKGRISFDPNQWAKAQLIRIARGAPESVPQIRAAIEQRIAAANVTDVLVRHRFLRQFPLELVAPQLRFELAEQLIAKEHVAEAENMLASLLGFLPTSAEQIDSTEISVDGLSKDSFIELWSKIHDAQYGTQVQLDAETPATERSAGLDYDRVNVTTNPVKASQSVSNVVQPRGEVASRLFKGKCLSIWGKHEFEVLGPTGESETRFEMFKEETPTKVGSGWIQTNHSLAILRRQSLVLALDLSKLQLGNEAVLWKRNVDPVLGSRSKFIGELDPIVNPSLRSEDVTASFPTTGCCCFIEKDKLTCIDAFTGETLWTRTKDPSHGYVLASGSQVVTLDVKLNQCSVFDLRTGERLQARAVSSLVESLWTIDGVSISAVGSVQPDSLDELEDFGDYRVVVEEPKSESESKGEEKEKVQSFKVRSSKSSRFLSRYDTGAGEFVWKKVFDREAKISRLSGDRFVVLSPDNQLYFFDFKTGKELAKHPSGLTENQRKSVRFFGGFEHLGKELIVMAHSKTGSMTGSSYSARPANTLSTFFSGHIMSLSQDKLEPVWNRPAEVDGFHLLPMLPSASPVLILNRKIQPTSSRSQAPIRQLGVPVISGSSLQLLALDMNDGHVVVNKVFGPVTSVRFTSPKVDLDAGTVHMGFAGWEVDFALEKSSDEPPSPVASVTKLNPVPRTFETEEAAANVAENMFDMEKLNKRLVGQAEEYEASLEEKRKQERALLEKETSR